MVFYCAAQVAFAQNRAEALRLESYINKKDSSRGLKSWKNLWSHLGSNQGLSDYESDTLTN